MLAIPGLLTLSEAIANAERTSPTGIAISAELCVNAESYEITLFRIDTHDLFSVVVHGITGKILSQTTPVELRSARS